jgi:hypothetical protein
MAYLSKQWDVYYAGTLEVRILVDVWRWRMMLSRIVAVETVLRTRVRQYPALQLWCTLSRKACLLLIHPPRQGLVSYYVSEPYEYRPGQEQQYKLADLSRRSPLFDKWHKVWFNRKKAESKSWLEDKKNGYRGRVWTPLFDKSVDDNRRETFSDFQEVVSAVRCLAQGLATANALPPDPHGIEPEPRLMVLQSVYVVLNLAATATWRLPHMSSVAFEL